MIYIFKAVDLLKPAFVNTYIVYIFGKIELLSIHASKIISKYITLTISKKQRFT